MQFEEHLTHKIMSIATINDWHIYNQLLAYFICLAQAFRCFPEHITLKANKCDSAAKKSK